MDTVPVGLKTTNFIDLYMFVKIDGTKHWFTTINVVCMYTANSLRIKGFCYVS